MVNVLHSLDLVTDYLVFKNIRLVCRLRKSSPSRTANTSSSPSSSQIAVGTATSTPNTPALPNQTMDSTVLTSPENTPLSSPTPANTTPTNRYFIMKSLTKEDLAWSVANKVWATQPHNESVLNYAFRVSSPSKHF